MLTDTLSTLVYLTPDTLSTIVYLVVLLGLAAGQVACLIRVGSASWPALKRVWTWSSSGKPLNCPTCMGSWCALLMLAVVVLGAYAVSFREPHAVFFAVSAVLATPGAAAVAAIVQRMVLVDELVLPELPAAPSAELQPAPPPGRPPHDQITTVVVDGTPELRHGCDCKTCREIRASWAKKEPRSP